MVTEAKKSELSSRSGIPTIYTLHTAVMAGPNRALLSLAVTHTVVEVFKFGCYVFFPIFAMLKFGDPEW